MLSARLEDFATKWIALSPDGTSKGHPCQGLTIRFAQFAFQQLPAGIFRQGVGKDNPLGALEARHVALTVG